MEKLTFNKFVGYAIITHLSAAVHISAKNFTTVIFIGFAASVTAQPWIA